MESNQKLRGIINKSKVVMSFYRTPPKPAASSTTTTTNQPIQVDEAQLAALLPLPNQHQKVSFVKSADINGGRGGGGAATLEETVDTRASSYISHVRERFRLERAVEHNYQDMRY
ncbi:hypothetical protein BVC80_1837g291 [Macleaya cordata]|uniref:Uncharacterized protein n=1 Tax=Macleaya cordata TaxID=56857 RepID=A0A200R422_MACCD|nr:hypothetical protein BVC80_1837g291 [Macleaya cordata]